MRRRVIVAALTVAGLALAPGSAGAATITPTPGFLVDNFSDNSNCSLREAIQIANTDNPAVENACAVNGSLGADTIVLSAGTYALTREEDASSNDNAQGDLDITEGPLVLDGTGAGTTTIDASGLVSPARVLHSISSKLLTVKELTVTGGQEAFGGGINVSLTAGSLYLVGAAVAGNSASSAGGGISSGGTLTVESSDVTGNAAAFNGGGIRASGPATEIKKESLIQGNTAAGLIAGGGIEAGNGTLEIRGSTVDDNHATGGFGGGISIGNSVSSATVTNSQVTGNTAPITRGAGGIRNAGTLTVEGVSEIAGNDAGFGGGVSSETGAVLQITGPVSLHHNTATSPTFGDGGAIASSGPTSIDGATLEDNDAARSGAAVDFEGAAPSQLSIANATIRRNFAASNGGAIWTSGQTAIAASVISSNGINAPDTADPGSHAGGGLFAGGNADVTIGDSTISANLSASADPDDVVVGGGIAASGDVRVLRSTLSGNLLLGGNASSRSGAGISVGGGITRLENATLSSNAAPGGPGAGGALSVGVGATAAVLQTTIAGNTAATASGIRSAGTTSLRRSIIDQGPTGCDAVGAQGIFIANNRNVDAGTSCVGAANDSDLETTAAMLGPLANNGGPTRTRALLPGSPAIDVTPNAGCTGLDKQPLTTDQRGFPRPVPPGGACDVGAFEVQ